MKKGTKMKGRDKDYFLGVDIGTGSVRAGIFDRHGTMASIATHPIELWRPKPDFVEQSSEDIWQACCKTIREAVDTAGIHMDDIRGLGFDATCSLVVLDENDQPLSVSPPAAGDAGDAPGAVDEGAAGSADLMAGAGDSPGAGDERDAAGGGEVPAGGSGGQGVSGSLPEPDRPASENPDGTNMHDSSGRNIIVWMDHRAKGEAAEITRTGHPVLNYVGGVMSAEMQTPKLLWLKRNHPETWARAAKFFDLSDYLVYRATGKDVRSACTTTCKWTFLSHENPAGAASDAHETAESSSFETGDSPGEREKAPDLPPASPVAGVPRTASKSPDTSELSSSGGSIGRWDDSYFREIGLEDLAENGYTKIGRRIRPAGEPVGGGLTGKAAGELGLSPWTAVGVAIIDAHAGGLGLLGMSLDAADTSGESGGGRQTDTESGSEAPVPAPAGPKHTRTRPETAESGRSGTSDGHPNLEDRVALIGGTSSCHMAVSREPKFINGVWGPYYSAMIPGLWLTEGGQSATGALIDHVIFSSRQSAMLEARAAEQQRSVYDLLNERLGVMAGERGVQNVGMLTENLHVLPYFHGNRSPRADPYLTGSISGLTLSSTLDDLALLYLATLQSIAFGTRHIIETMNENGYSINLIMATGGGTKNEIFLQQHADICRCRIILPREPEAVLLGSAVLGAVAAKTYSSVMEAMKGMNRAGRVVEPAGAASDAGDIAAYHDAKYRIFQRLYEDSEAYREIMAKRE